MERNEEQNGRVQLEFMNKTQPMEWTAEITLPDYRSEISRLLWVRPTVMHPSRFVGGGKADFSGPVRYDILYTGPDGALYSAEAEEGYSFSVPLDSLSDFEARAGVQVCARPKIDAVISRVTGPRKLSVRCRMHADVRGYAVKDLTPRVKGEGKDESAIHRLCDAVENGRLYADGAEQFEVNDGFMPESGQGDLRLIASHGEVLLPDASAADGCVRCRGEAVITLLFCREGGEEAGTQCPFTVVRRIPFEREVLMDGVTPDCRALAEGKMGEIRATVDESGVSLAAQVVLAAEAQNEESVLICRDMYLPGYHAECRFGEERLWSSAFCGNRNFSISGEQSAADLGMPADAEVIDAMADAEIKDKSAEGNRAILGGEMHCRVLYRHKGEYGVAEMSVPFRTVLEDCGEDMTGACCVPVCRVSLTRDQLRADAEVQMMARTENHRTVRVLEEVTFTPLEPMERADFEICYPGEQDTLWEVGKRYGVSPAELAEANGLPYDMPGSPEVLTDIPYLLIP